MHVYCKCLLECRDKGAMEKLTDHFLILLYKMIFEEEPPCMSHGAMEVVSKIVDLFASPYDTFLRMFGGYN